MFNTTVWIAEGFLALFFLMAGLPKIVGKGIDRWVGFNDLPRGMTILIGASEVAPAIALVVPILVGQGQWTTPLAGMGIVVISLMAAASIFVIASGWRRWKRFCGPRSQRPSPLRAGTSS